jgi:hypothetical protein
LLTCANAADGIGRAHPVAKQRKIWRIRHDSNV